MSLIHRKILITYVGTLILFIIVFSLLRIAYVPPQEETNYTDNGEPYTIRYLMPVLGPNKAQTCPDIDEVNKQLNILVKEKINATVELVPYEYNTYSNQVGNLILSAEKFDMCYTSPTIINYIMYNERGSFIKLDNLLQQYAPKTWAMYDSEIWDQARFKGDIMASINNQVLPRALAYDFKDVTALDDFLKVKFAGITIDGAEVNHENLYLLPAEYDRLDIVEEYLLYLKNNSDRYPDYRGLLNGFDFVSVMQNYFGFDDMCSGMTTPGVVRFDDDVSDGVEVINQFESEEFISLIERIGRMVSAGTMPGLHNQNLTKDVYDLQSQSNWKPGQQTVIYGGENEEVVRFSEHRYFSSFTIGTMTAISSTSQNPARTMKFIELLNTDAEIFNLLKFGIEGRHYEKVENEENVIKMKPRSVRYKMSSMGWAIGNDFLGYLTKGQPKDVYKQSEIINENAEKSPVLGFIFIPGEYRQKIADCQSVVDMYLTQLMKGQTLDVMQLAKQLQNELKDAGVDALIAEKQRQINEFLARSENNSDTNKGEGKL